jgi:hypothetical protein
MTWTVHATSRIGDRTFSEIDVTPGIAVAFIAAVVLLVGKITMGV